MQKNKTLMKIKGFTCMLTKYGNSLTAFHAALGYLSGIFSGATFPQIFEEVQKGAFVCF